MCQLEIEQGSGKFRRVKLRHVFQLFSKANELHGQSELLQDRNDHAPFGAAVEFCKDDARASGCFRETLGLTQRILSGSGIQYQKDFMRTPSICLPITRRILSSCCIRLV